TGLGSFQAGGLGFTDLPGIEGRGGYAQATYLITGETRPENGTPKVKHPFLGPGESTGGGRGLGAWEVAFRYNFLHINEPGAILPNFLTPGLIPTFNDHTDGFTAGVNWYLNNWVKYQINLDIDRLKEPSVQGQIPQTFYVVLNRLQFRF
ncbi:MAG TPA: porin, partial [Terriglobales bacterium]|nr:porin [Terriglobales bacterium]